MKLPKDKYWLKSGSFSLLERLSFMVFGFGSVFFLLRALSKEDFGAWALFLTVTAFIEVARNGLVQNALVKNLAGSEGREERGFIMTASLVINSLLTVVSIVVIVSIAGLLSASVSAPVLEQMLYIYIATTVILILFSHFNFVQQANLDFKGNFFSNFVRQGSLFVYIVVLFILGKPITLINLVLFQVIAAIAGAAVSFIFARKYIIFSTHLDRAWMKRLFDYGKFTFGTNLGSMLYRSIDKLMLGPLLKSTAPVAIYDLAIRITNLIEVPTASMAAIVFPQSAKKAVTEGHQAVKYLYEKSVGAILALIIPGLIVIFIFADFVILIVAGEKYLDTVPILRWTLAYGIFIPFSRQFGTALDSIGKPKINFYFVLLSAALNVIFNYIFITNYGLIGAVYGTLTTFAIRFVLNYVVLKRVLNINVFNAFIYMKVFYVDGFNTVVKFAKGKLQSKNSMP